MYELWPAAGRDQDSAGVVHWASPPGSSDPFLAGAYAALAWSLDLVFGDALGALLTQSTIENVERWNGSAWVPVA